MLTVFLLALALILLLAFLFHIAIPYKKSTQEFQDAINKIPGPGKYYPFIGTMPYLNVPSNQYLPLVLKIFDKYGPRFRIWSLGNPIIFLRDAKDVQVLLKSNTNISKSSVYLLLRDWLGDGLLLSTGEKWFLHRKLLTSAFHFKILEHHKSVTERNCKILLDLLEPHAKDGKPFDIYPYITNCALDIISESAMGVNIKAQLERGEYPKAVYRISTLFKNRQRKFWLYHPWAFLLFTSEGRENLRLLKFVHQFTENIIKKRKEEYRLKKQQKESNPSAGDKQKEKLSFLDLLIEVSENDSRIGDKEIREEVDTFMFEGHDTTASAMNSCIHLLGNHPEIQETVAEEIENSTDRIKGLPFLERCIKETLRIYPPVASFSRKLTVPLELDGLTIPPNTDINIITYAVHRDPKAFPDPEKFNPDRFLNEGNDNRNPFVYIPFSAGPRNCIGQKFAMIEMLNVLSSVFSRYRVKSLDKTTGVLHEIILKPDRSLKTVISERYPK